MKRLQMIRIVIFVFAIALLAGNTRGQEIHNSGFIVVSPGGPDDGGDYGPGTPGTTTSGIQEAVDFAKSNRKEVYIIGGGDNGIDGPVTYTIDSTIHIPWGQDWQITGGNYVLNFTQTTGDCLHIDSAMNCRFEFGTIQAPNLVSGNLVAIRPETQGPDNFVVIVASEISIDAIIGNGIITNGDVQGVGTGLRLDGTISSLFATRISVKQITRCQTGVYITNGGVSGNILDCQSITACNTHLLDEGGWSNNIRLWMDTSGLNGSTMQGVRLTGGASNIYTIGLNGNFDPGDALLIEDVCENNLIYTMGIAADDISQVAIFPTNRIVPTQPIGFTITTPPIPPSTTSSGGTINNTGYSVVVTILTAGNVQNWRLFDALANPHVIAGPLSAGQSIYLEPGEIISLNYTTAPTWAWRAVR